jgi:hypothetical protein
MQSWVLQIICRLRANAKRFDFIAKFNFFLKSDFKKGIGQREQGIVWVLKIYL